MTGPLPPIRGAGVPDAPAIARIQVTAWREAYADILPAPMLEALNVEERTARWADLLNGGPGRPGVAAFVAERDGRPCGFVSVGLQRDEGLRRAGFGGEVSALYLLRADQGRGLGRALMAAGARHLRDSGQEAAALWVLEGNLPARGFYDHLGGKVVGRRTEERPDGPLEELAYGWTRFADLAG
jgi:ribosomal protein S18 acetylase RimI-like enzyme